MNRMARRFGSPAMQDAAVRAYDHSRQVLDGLLFGAVRRALDGVGAGKPREGSVSAAAGTGTVDGAGPGSDPGGAVDRPLIIVPTGSLHALPWTALPTCAGRPVSVTPSARLWLAAANAAEDAAAGSGPAEGGTPGT